MHAIDSLGNVVPNVATNFAGVSASVVPTAKAPNYQGLFYLDPESGWGIRAAGRLNAARCPVPSRGR